MRVKVFDRLHGVRVSMTTRTKSGDVTEVPFNPISHVPAPLAALLASADIVAPVAGRTLDIETLDAKMAGLPIERRLEIKSAMRQAGMLA
jgi:hypothetical protein